MLASKVDKRQIQKYNTYYIPIHTMALQLFKIFKKKFRAIESFINRS